MQRNLSCNVGGMLCAHPNRCLRPANLRLKKVATCDTIVLSTSRPVVQSAVSYKHKMIPMSCPICCLAIALALTCGGCAHYSAWYEASADREVLNILQSKKSDAIEQIQKNVRMPEPEKPPAPGQTGKQQEEPRRTLSLRGALQAAIAGNRDYLTARDAMYLSALALTGQQRNFGPILTSTFSALFTDGSVRDATGRAVADLGVRNVLDSGGTLSVSTDASARRNFVNNKATTLSHSVGISFEQPLLRGFGYEASHESLTQAERDVIYALRDFELFRQSFLIDTVRRYYAIVRQKKVVQNSYKTLERFLFLRRRSEALFEIGKVRAIDKFRAAQEELIASNEVLAEEEVLASLLDDFKVFLGLPTSEKIDVEDITPEVMATPIDLQSAIAAALHNRLDLRTSKDRVEDAERAVRIARNKLLPDLDITTSVGASASRAGDEATGYEGEYAVGLSLSLPLDKVSDRNAYKSAMLALQRRQRLHGVALDSVKQEVMNTYRRLRRLENSVRIQTANVELAERRVKNAELRFEAGELGNRDVVEAQSAKLSSENALIRAILDYDLARLQLKKDIGILLVDKDGMWVE